MGQWERFLQHEEEVVRRREAAAAARYRAAREQAELLALLLADQFDVVSVYLLGSLVTGGFSLTSDIDLAVTGLSPDRFFAAWSALSQATDFKVDLVDLQNAPEGLRSLIRGEGVLICDRQSRANR